MSQLIKIYRKPPETMTDKAPRIIAIANQKGGVGKTTTAVNLATAMAAIYKRVLLIDLDPQGNASTGLGIPQASRAQGIYDMLFDSAPLSALIKKTEVPNLDIVPSTVDLSGAEIELVSIENREFRLKEAFQAAYADYDYILIDCPPSLGLLTLNALVAADSVIVPLQCEFYALEGLSHLVRTIERVKRALNPKLELEGVVLTMYDKRNSLSNGVVADVRAHFPDKIYNTMIPRNVRVSEAPSHGKPVMLYDFKCIGSQAYIQLAKEVLVRQGALPHLQLPQAAA